MAKYTDAPEIFHTAVATNLLGAVLTRHRYRCRLAGGTPARWTNMFTWCVGDSGDSRKSTAVNMGLEVLNRAMPELLLPDDCSPEGFARAFAKKGQADEDDAAGIIINDELGLFLMQLQKEYMASLKGMMMKFFDVPPNYERQLSRDSFSVKTPRFSILGGVALELLPVLTATEDWLGGFMGRVLIVYASRTREQDRARTVPSDVYDKLAEQLWKTIRAWRTERIAQKKWNDFLFDYDDAALKAEKALRGSFEKSPDDNVRLLHARAPVHLMKMAAVEQIALDPTSPFITAAAVKSSASLFERWWKGAPEVMEMAFARSRADTEGDRLARRILRLVRNKGPAGYPEIELMKATMLDYDLFQRALRSLEMSNMIERCDPGDGGAIVIRFRA